MEALKLFSCGVLGGALVEFSGIWRFYRIPHKLRPIWLKSRFYWACTVARVLLGGFVVIVYVWYGSLQNGFLALHVGASLPLFINTLTGKTAPILPGSTD